MIKGACECGKVRYEVAAEITDFSHCHCSQCRRLHGAAFASFGAVPREKFRYVSGETDIRTYASSRKIDRVFCGNCGSNILADFKSEPEVLYVTMGTVDGAANTPPAYHIFTGSKATWYTICDGLPQYDQYADE